MQVEVGSGEFQSLQWQQIEYIAPFTVPFSRLLGVTWEARGAVFSRARVRNNGSYNAYANLNADARVSITNPTNPNLNLLNDRIYVNGNAVIPGRSSGSVFGSDSTIVSGSFPASSFPLFQQSQGLPVLLESLDGRLPTVSGGVVLESRSLESLGSLTITYTYDLIGDEQADPIFPTQIINDNFVFQNVPSGRWFDAVQADGFIFATLAAGELFTSIDSFASGSATPFSIFSGNTLLGNFEAGDSIVLPGQGVSSFLALSPGGRTDPFDPLGFPMQLSFNHPSATFVMIPVRVVSEPNSASLASLAFITLLVMCSRGRLAKASFLVVGGYKLDNA